MLSMSFERTSFFLEEGQLANFTDAALAACAISTMVDSIDISSPGGIES